MSTLDTFENVFVSKHSPSTLSFLSIFQMFLVHTEMSESAKIILLHMRETKMLAKMIPRNQT